MPRTLYARTAHSVRAHSARRTCATYTRACGSCALYIRAHRTHAPRAPTAHRTHLQKWWYFIDFGGVVLKLVVFLKIGGVFFRAVSAHSACALYAHTARSVRAHRAHCTHAPRVLYARTVRTVRAHRAHCTRTPRAPTAHRTRFQNW